MNARDAGPFDPSWIDTQGWQASLALEYGSGGSPARTRPTRREHYGPLRVLKGYPSATGQPDLWEQIIVHPPGGIAAGDQLEIDIALTSHSHVLMTSPGAAKWYRSRSRHTGDDSLVPGLRASQRVFARIADHASLEWLPLEGIVFNQANACLETRLELANQATYIGADLICLGRPAGNVPFSEGRLRLNTRVSRNGSPLFIELADICLSPRDQGAARVLDGVAGLGGASCFGTLIAVPPMNQSAHLTELANALRAKHAAAPVIMKNELAITALPELIVARWRGDSAQRGWDVLRPLWHSLRVALLGQRIEEPRIWRC